MKYKGVFQIAYMNLIKNDIDIDISQFSKSTQKLIHLLHSHDLRQRLNARLEIVKKKSKALDFLEILLKSEYEQLRWEAVKCIVEIHSKKSIPLLLKVMNKDSESDVREVAARGLSKFGTLGVEPLLHRLIRGKGIVFLYETATYTLRKQEDLLQSEHLRKLITVLLNPEMQKEIVPFLANEVLKDLQKTTK